MGSKIATAQRGATAMRSPVSWALLGLVIQRPSYGYELVQRFERTYGDALELSSPSQIYTALDALVQRGMIEELPSEEMAAIGRQPKPHYRATAAGVSDYEQWLIAHADEDRRRGRLFAQQLAVLAPERALAVIERYERACLQEAGRTAPAARPGAGREGAGGLAARLLAEEHRVATGAKLAWIEYARRELAALVRARAGRP